MSAQRRTIGGHLALLFSTMNPMIYHHFCRRKAVWGPKRTASALLFAFFCLAPNTAVAKAHQYQGAKKQSGVKNASVKDYKLDDELTVRSNGRNGNSTTRV